MSESVEMVKDNSEDAAHEDFLTIQHFGMLREAAPIKAKTVGASVAVLVQEHGRFKVVHGLIYGSEHFSSGTVYHVILRDGKKINDAHVSHVVAV